MLKNKHIINCTLNGIKRSKINKKLAPASYEFISFISVRVYVYPLVFCLKLKVKKYVAVL